MIAVISIVMCGCDIVGDNCGDQNGNIYILFRQTVKWSMIAVKDSLS